MLNNNFKKEQFFCDFLETVGQIYQYGWAERNGGNISYLIDDELILPYLDDETFTREITLTLPCPELKNKFLLVTGSGKFYRNICNPKKVQDNCGIIRINENGTAYEIHWGFKNGAVATSELPSHLQSHKVRLEQDHNHRLVIHSHLTHLIALTFVLPLDEKTITHKLWEMISECSVVFPEGLGIVPWMLPGSDKVGLATADKMKIYKNVIWPHHGIFASGDTFDNVLGCLEIIDKAAAIYLTILKTNEPVLNTITNENLKEMQQGFKITLKPEFIK